jgi:DNA-binding transcriptional regulator YhcF (GntR family)
MLGKLFGSNARVKILKIFLLNPTKKYYIRQLARDLDLQVNSVRRELENLEKLGLLSSSLSLDSDNNDKEGEKSDLKTLMEGKVLNKKDEASVSKKGAQSQEKKYYQSNHDFLLFEELKALIIKAQILHEQEFIENIKKLGKIKLFILTGFFVGNDSPVDILIVGKVNKAALAKTVSGLEKEIGRDLNFASMEGNEFKYRRDITDVFLYEILEGKKIVILDELGFSSLA